MRKIQYIKSYFDILFIGEEFTFFRVIFIIRFSDDDLKKEGDQIYLLIFII
jgi:hypothetical protein